MILLDTHVLLWMDGDETALGRPARSLIDDALTEEGLALSAIIFRECAMLHQRRRKN